MKRKANSLNDHKRDCNYSKRGQNHAQSSKIPTEKVDEDCSDDNSDSEDDDEDDNDSEGNDTSDGFEEQDLPIMFLMLAKSKLQSSAQLQAAKEALDKSRYVILENDTDKSLKNMLQKAEKRINCASSQCLSIGSIRFLLDGKVPPGSGQVKRSVTDSRFLLSVVNFEMYRVSSILGNSMDAYNSLRECLIWFPRHIEANFILAETLRAHASDNQYLQQAEALYRKCMETGMALKAASSSSSRKQSADETQEDDIAALDNELMDCEMKAFKKSGESLILFLCQEHGHDVEVQKEVYSLLVQNNYTWKLSNAVLHYPLPPQLNSSESRLQVSDAGKYIRIVENALQSTYAIDHLKQVFRHDSAFWSEHDYDTSTNCSRKVGYFSYLYPLRDRAAVCSIEQIIDYIYSVTCKYFPSVKEAKYAEWWVHTRPHSNGHQLHYDSDETRIESGRSPAHPIASTVLFLSDDIGGPTLVTDQVIGGPLASSGWLCHSKTNRLAMFDASYLHGVIPGRGISKTSKESDHMSSILSSTASKSSCGRRLTFMVGFWREIAAADRGVDRPGPGQPFPDSSKSQYTWPAEMKLSTDLNRLVDSKEDTHEEVDAVRVDSIWEPIDCLLQGGKTSGGGGSSSSSSSEQTSSSPPCYSKCFQGF